MTAFVTRLLTGSLALAVAIAACTYAPHPREGEQDCYQGRCVDGYVCAAVDNKCYTPANLPTVTGTGGAPAGTGGFTTVGTGGAGSGGLTGTGGKIGSGGVTGLGGVTGAGGATGVGGVTGAGGTTTPPNAGTVVTVANGQAQGAMTGYGWVALGPLDTVTDPTCSSPLGPITGATTCDLTLWSTPSAYCVSGYLPAVLNTADYANNWGIQLGINSTPATGGVLGQPFATISVSMTGAPQTGLRFVAHRRGDVAAATYCAAMTGLPVAFTSFNTACWDAAGSGTQMTAADVPNLDLVGVMVPSAPTAVTLSNLCLVGITFGK